MKSYPNMLQTSLAMFLRSGWVAASTAVCMPMMVNAQTSTSEAQSSAQAVGRVLGMMLFGFLVLRWINRRKEDHSSSPKTGLRGPVKPVYVVLTLVLGLALLMWVSG
jgi:hypothetical protein